MEKGILKRYEPKAVIGRGGNGVVWSCVDKITSQTVAIKMIPHKRISRWKYSNQYEYGKIPYEVYILGLLIDCQQCIKLLGYYEGKYYPTAYKSVDAPRDLFEFLESQEYIPEFIAKIIFKQLAKGLSVMHSNNITHGDIKDENILVDKGLNVYYVDFGAAQENVELSPCSQYRGTIQYAPPEIFMDDFYSTKNADVWMLGTILYILLHGSQPFESSEESVSNSIRRIEGHELWQDLIEYMLSKKPLARPTIDQVLSNAWLTEPL